jgi:hypothetical protein
MATHAPVLLTSKNRTVIITEAKKLLEPSMNYQDMNREDSFLVDDEDRIRDLGENVLG